MSTTLTQDPVAATIGGHEITQSELRAYFTRVCPQILGAPIDCKIYVASDFELGCIAHAIERYTGHTARFTLAPDCCHRIGIRVRVQAAAADRNLLEMHR